MLNKELNKIAKEIKRINKEQGCYQHPELEKATLKDLKVLVTGIENNNFAEVHKTKLYNKLSCGYCIALEIIHNNNLVK